MSRRATGGAPARLLGATLLAALAGAPLAATPPPASAPPPATETPPPAPRREPTVYPPPTAADMPPILKQVEFDQRLGEQVPLDLEFHDETGKAVRLGDYFGDRPVVLSLVYYDCPMICGLALQGLASSLKPIAFTVGREFQVVTVSFDPRETPELARMKKTVHLSDYGREGAATGWHFLTGEPEPIKRLTDAVGFHYAWDEEQKQFAHPTGIVVLTPEGRIARYFFGIEYAPRDLRLGLVEAADNRIGTLADALLLLCYHYDPKTGRYSATAMGLVRIAGGLTVLALGAFIVVMVGRDRRKARALSAADGGAPATGPEESR